MQGAHFRVAGHFDNAHFDNAHFGHELRQLLTVEQLGADIQLPRRGLCAAALAGQAQGLHLKRLAVFTPFVRRRPAGFSCHNRRDIRPSSVRHF